MKFLIFILSINLCFGQMPTVKQQLQNDTWQHNTAGAFIASNAYWLSYHTTERRGLSAIFSIGVGGLAGWTKETYDNRKGGTGFSNRDLFNTCMGSITGVITIAAIIDACENEHDRHYYKSVKLKK